jgi:hypothetical protein
VKTLLIFMFVASLAFGEDQCMGKFQVAVCVESSNIPRDDGLPNWDRGLPFVFAGSRLKKPCFSSDEGGKHQLVVDPRVPKDDYYVVFLNEESKTFASCHHKKEEPMPVSFYVFYESRGGK